MHGHKLILLGMIRKNGKNTTDRPYAADRLSSITSEAGVPVQAASSTPNDKFSINKIASQSLTIASFWPLIKPAKYVTFSPINPLCLSLLRSIKHRWKNSMILLIT